MAGKTGYARDPDRPWTGVRKVKHVIIGETHAQRKQRRKRIKQLKEQARRLEEGR